MDNDVALIYLKKTPSPSNLCPYIAFIYKNFFDWISNFKERMT